MDVKIKDYVLRGGDVIDRLEFHDGNYGAPGKKRKKKKKPTKEDMQKVNSLNKARKARQKMLEYMSMDDIWASLEYLPKNRPVSLKAAGVDFANFMKIVRREYKKRGRTLFWFKNIEKGTKGRWHIHIVINEIGDTASILEKAWNKGGVWATALKKSKFYDEDFTKISNYITKDKHTREVKKDGTLAKPRIAESSYNTSRNMPLPDPDEKDLVRWQRDPKPKKGYYIINAVEGINPKTGYKYRRYTMIRLKPKKKIDWISVDTERLQI